MGLMGVRFSNSSPQDRLLDLKARDFVTDQTAEDRKDAVEDMSSLFDNDRLIHVKKHGVYSRFRAEISLHLLGGAGPNAAAAAVHFKGLIALMDALGVDAFDAEQLRQANEVAVPAAASATLRAIFVEKMRAA